MGVTNRNEVHCKNAEQSSSTESLHIPLSNSQISLLSASSVENIPVPRIRARRQRGLRNVVLSPVRTPRNAGRRRQRRFRAVAELAAFIEEEEEGEETYLEEGIPHSSPFSTIIENPELEHIWEQLTTDDEIQQAKLLDKNTTGSTSESKSTLAAYKNVAFHIKMTFKMMRSVHELENAEEEIVEFFTNSPDNSYVNGEKSSFQRLLIHGVAQYYCLKSSSFDAPDGKRTIKVENPHKLQSFCDKKLFSIVQDNHNKRV